MNKGELIARIAGKSERPKALVGEIVEAVFSEIERALAEGEEVRIVSFGNFVVASRAASVGRNPRTHEIIDIPASKTPKFRPGKALKESVNRARPS